MLKKVLISLFLIVNIFLLSPKGGLAQSNKQNQDQIMEGVITAIVEEKQIDVMGKKQLYQKLKINITDGSIKNKTINVENGSIAIANIQKYKVGDQVLLTLSKDNKGKQYYYINDYIRRFPLLILFLIFITLVILVGRARGVASIFSMIISFYFIFSFILPQISAGNNPIIIVILASLFIIPLTFYLSHGINKKTTISIVATFISLIIAGVLLAVFTELTKLTGYTSEEASFLQVAKNNVFNMRDLLMAGIIVGILGVLDDITIAQAGIVFQLKEVNDKLTFKDLYLKSMNIGQDHISSMVNTLILVYAGASFPLLLLFIDNPKPLGQIINHEVIATEIVRMLIGSIALIITVPITTLIAAFYAQKTRRAR